MKEKVFHPLSMTVEKLIEALGEDHPMCQGVLNLPGRTVTVDRDKFNEEAAKRGLNPEPETEEPEDA